MQRLRFISWKQYIKKIFQHMIFLLLKISTIQQKQLIFLCQDIFFVKDKIKFSRGLQRLY